MLRLLGEELFHLAEELDQLHESPGGDGAWPCIVEEPKWGGGHERGGQRVQPIDGVGAGKASRKV